MDYRNALAIADGRIDCEIKHPRFGWIPYTIDPADTAAGIDAAALYERITTAGDAAPYTPPPPEAIAAEQQRRLLEQLTTEVQAHLDTTAQAAGYDNIYTAVTYADEPAVPKFAAEGAAFRAWRSLVWDTANAIRNDVQAGRRPVPTAAELISELPPLSFPTEP